MMGRKLSTIRLALARRDPVRTQASAMLGLEQSVDLPSRSEISVGTPSVRSI
jgi:hypothetical protein